MVLAINESLSIYPHTEIIKNGPDSPSKIVRLFRQYMSEFSFLMRGTSTLFSWGRLLPVSKALQLLSTTVQTHINAASSLFTIPRAVFNHLDLYNASIDLWKTMRSGSEVKKSEILNKSKVVFVKTINSSNSLISIIRLLNQYSIIKFREMSGQLYNGLLRTQNILFLVTSSITWIESMWAMGNQVRMEGPSSNLVRSVVKVCSASARLVASALRTAILFIGISLGPMTPWILVSLSSWSFLSDLVTKMLNEGHFIYDDDTQMLLQDLSDFCA